MADTLEASSSGNTHFTPPEIREAAATVAESLLPTKSRQLYEKAYTDFMEWKSIKSISSMSERVFLVYFQELSPSKTSTLWSLYSKLKAVMKIRHNLNMENFYQLKSFIKRHGENYTPKQSAIFSSEEIERFLKEAPDSQYLVMKVVCIFGIKGACRSCEMVTLTMSDISEYKDMLVVKIPITKNKKARQFIIDAEFYHIVKKYMALRPEKIKENRFFIKYRNGKCANQVMGIHKIGKIPQEIATYLNRPNPNEYTGHSFRRTSATLLVDAGGNMETLKRHGGWRSDTVAERYIDVSLQNTKSTAKLITKNVDIRPTVSTEDIQMEEVRLIHENIENEDVTFTAEDIQNAEVEFVWDDVPGINDIQSPNSIAIEPPAKKFKLNKPLSTIMEQSINVQSTELDKKNVTIQFVNCTNMTVNLK